MGGLRERSTSLRTSRTAAAYSILVMYVVVLTMFWRVPPVDLTAASRFLHTCRTWAWGVALAYDAAVRGHGNLTGYIDGIACLDHLRIASGLGYSLWIEVFLLRHSSSLNYQYSSSPFRPILSHRMSGGKQLAYPLPLRQPSLWFGLPLPIGEGRGRCPLRAA